MYHGVLVFSAKIDLNNVAIHNYLMDKGWCRCFIDVQDYLIKMVFELEVSSQNDFYNMFSMCNSLSVDIVNRISFFVDSKSGDVSYCEGRFVGDDGCVIEYTDVNLKSLSLRTAWSVGIFVDNPEFKVIIEDSDQSNELFFSAYKYCISIDNVVSKFMFLYNILFSLVGDTCQKDVDDLIRSIDKNVIESLSPKNKLETIYTRLRNEVGHARGVEFDAIGQDMARCVFVFQGIVKKAIMRKVENNRNVASTEKIFILG